MDEKRVKEKMARALELAKELLKIRVTVITDAGHDNIAMAILAVKIYEEIR